MPLAIALIAAVVALTGCKSDDVAQRDTERTYGQMEQAQIEQTPASDESLESEWEEVASEAKDTGQALGDATEETADAAGTQIKQGAYEVKEELDELGEAADEEFGELKREVDEEFDDEDEVGDVYEGDDDFAEAKLDARKSLDRIKIETQEIRSDLDQLGESGSTSFQREFSELEQRSLELEREIESLEAQGERAWNEAEQSLENSLRRLENDLDRFEEKIDIDDDEVGELSQR